ncbi:MAG TPA: NUDIX domain-containing protein [Cyclobacteriaceae bacterium]|nr:NUDIX domain-containing protein [Cyclobacteriaceae bacterium]
MENPVHQIYGNRVRVRTCGICIMGDSMVMVNHRFLTDGDFWAPPGGGIEFGEDASACLSREFQEETGLRVDVGPFLFACELVKPPLHSIELFFHVVYKGGELTVGKDPESGGQQIIKDVRMLTAPEIRKLRPGEVHGILEKYPDIGQITALRGYFKL